MTSKLSTKRIFQIMFNKQQTAMKTGSTIPQVAIYLINGFDACKKNAQSGNNE